MIRAEWFSEKGLGVDRAMWWGRKIWWRLENLAASRSAILHFQLIYLCPFIYLNKPKPDFQRPDIRALHNRQKKTTRVEPCYEISNQHNRLWSIQHIETLSQNATIRRDYTWAQRTVKTMTSVLKSDWLRDVLLERLRKADSFPTDLATKNARPLQITEVLLSPWTSLTRNSSCNTVNWAIRINMLQERFPIATLS